MSSIEIDLEMFSNFFFTSPSHVKISNDLGFLQNIMFLKYSIKEIIKSLPSNPDSIKLLNLINESGIFFSIIFSIKEIIFFGLREFNIFSTSTWLHFFPQKLVILSNVDRASLSAPSAVSLISFIDFSSTI